MKFFLFSKISFEIPEPIALIELNDRDAIVKKIIKTSLELYRKY